MHHSVKFLAPALVLTLGFSGNLQAAGGSSQGMGSQSKGMGQQAGQTETITGEVLKVQEDLYTIKDEQGKEVRLRIEQDAFQGQKPQKGDKIQAKVDKDQESYQAISAKKAGQSGSGQSQNQGQSQQQNQQSQSGEFTKTIQGKVQKVEGNTYYVQTEQGEEVRLRLDQSAQKEGEIKEGDMIEAQVTKEKEFHVISAQASQ